VVVGTNSVGALDIAPAGYTWWEHCCSIHLPTFLGEHSMSLISINWNPDTKELRKFGWTVLIGLGLMGTFLYFAPFIMEEPKPLAAKVCWSIGASVALFGISGTRAALPFYWIWMSFAFVMGNIVSRLVLIAFYFGVIIPIGLLMRITGRDKLKLRRQSVDSYWCDITLVNDQPRYKRQF
jgi:hypothetical protein